MRPSKYFRKQWKGKKKKYRKITFLARNTLNSIEKIMSKELIDSDISHEDFMIGINEEQNYLRLKVSVSTK